MKTFIQKTFFVLTILATVFISLPQVSEAYVSVKGYYRKDGTYVSPHVRSNPNGLKYDNYSYTPSQGLYNKTYGTRDAYWDTPTYVTDPNYYEGKALYESGSSGTYNTSSYTSSSRTDVSVPQNATASQYGGWYCNSGYKKNYTTNQCDRVIVPTNASLNYFGDGWVCNSGYKRNYQTDTCNKVIIPANASLNYFGDGWVCNSGYKINYSTNQCDRVIVPANASLNYFGDGWVCNSGYKRSYSTNQCDRVIIPSNASLNYFGDGWYCNDGYIPSGQSCIAK
jgi:hypothetical protein